MEQYPKGKEGEQTGWFATTEPSSNQSQIDIDQKLEEMCMKLHMAVETTMELQGQMIITHQEPILQQGELREKVAAMEQDSPSPRSFEPSAGGAVLLKAGEADLNRPVEDWNEARGQNRGYRACVDLYEAYP